MHQQFPQIAIAMFADPKQARLPARALLPGDQPEPGRKLAAIFELGGIADRRHSGRGRQLPKPRNRQEPLTYRVRLRHVGQLGVIGRHTRF